MEDVMKRSLSVFLLYLVFLSTVSAQIAWAQYVREPSFAGGFYPKDPVKLRETLSAFIQRAEKTEFIPPEGNHALKALILPHAGYIYSGWTAAHASKVLKGKRFKRVVLMGPDHRVGFYGASLTGYDEWKTPLGSVPIDACSKQLSQKHSNRFKTILISDQQEHSLEVIVPYLQSFLTDFSLVPIVLGKDNPRELSSNLTSIIPPSDDNTLWVVSSDLSHYLPYDTAVKKDRKTIDLILENNSDELKTKGNAACGMLPILCIMEVAKQYGWKPYLIHYSNSGDTEGDKDKVVGYAAIAYYGGYNMTNDSKDTSDTFTPEQGRVLVELARSTIAGKLGQKAPEVTIPDDASFKTRRGTFVTLKIHGQLRGCIGNLSAEGSVVEGVRRNAISAAFNDYRFSPLTADELKDVDVEVSILTDPKPLSHSGGKDLLSKLTPKQDGVIIRMGRSGATFLPQVWDQLPQPEEFLRHLCMKAGLKPDAWTSPDLEVSTYRVQYFEED